MVVLRIVCSSIHASAQARLALAKSVFGYGLIKGISEMFVLRVTFSIDGKQRHHPSCHVPNALWKIPWCKLGEYHFAAPPNAGIQNVKA